MSQTIADWKSTEPAPTDRSSERSQGSFMPRFGVAYTRSASGELKPQLRLSVPATIQFESNGVFIARVLSLPGCVSQGPTKDEAKENLKSALIDVIKLHATLGTRPAFQEPDYLVVLSTLVDIHVNGDETA